MPKLDATVDSKQTLRRLVSTIQSTAGFDDVTEALHANRPASIDGVWGSSMALIAASLASESISTLLVISARQNDIDDFCDELTLFSDHPYDRFPAIENDETEAVSHDDEYGQRLRTLKRLARSDAPPILVSCITSLMQPVVPPSLIKHNSRRIARGGQFNSQDLAQWLTEHGFHGTSAVELPGEFSVRGGVFDVFAPDWQDPVRFELFGDEVESIRVFDVVTQRSLNTCDEVDISVLGDQTSRSSHLADYLPPDSWIMVSEPDEVYQEAERYESRQDDSRTVFSLLETLKRLRSFPTVNVAGISTGSHEASCQPAIRSVERFSGEVGRIRDELEEVGQKQQVFVVCETAAEAKRLEEIFASTTLAARQRLSFPIGRLREGFHLVDDAILLVSGAELFRRAPLRRTTRRHAGKAIDSFLELREGDLVVHLAHGIGRYRGMSLLTKDGQSEDHLEIEFHGGTRVYVPASRIEIVQKYVGGTRARPSLAKLGGKTWLKQKQAAETSVTDMAIEMLELQAARASKPGIAFAADTEWQREFDSSFPYHETPDQGAAMAAIKTDMTQTRPMDRLLCGDVGFGKTELSMRAAFKAVDNGYQVAVLVPTTILAEQHHRTFHERMAEFPFEIAKLSRFCTAKEQRETVERLAAGNIDIVVGTHRLASRDVQFQNLGLLVIDEEQRFGVAVKERLKALRTEIDVLTMTATPIPRTLHLSLLGLRDISNLETPPEDRVAVETRVTRWDESLIRHAVLRELNRGGQIFFVHNRVHDIEAIAHRLGRIVPEASLRIGHGQMPEGELEQVMVDFVAHRFDLLLATTIVESGLDIPNANTIFIDDADRYGLADLHQLRGRVGRYKHRAYCYLLVETGKHVSPHAARRLRAIEEYSNMGAGFAIAMRDLEFRGAGNVLGTQQSGHIAAVGYELYCQLLEAAVRRLKQLPAKESVDVTIELPGQAYLPRDYVADMRSKIDIYRRLSRLTAFDQLDHLREELIDRFGSPPKPAERMLELASLRLDAAVWGIHRIFVEDKYLVLEYSDRGRIDQLAKTLKNGLRIVDAKSAYLPMKEASPDPDQLIATTKSVLRP